MEQLEYNLLFRWFVGLNMDETVWVPTVFTKNRDRLLEGDIAEKFFAHVLAQARIANLLSDEHFSVDGTLIEAWASHRAFSARIALRLHQTTPAIRRSTSTARSAAMRRINQRRTLTRDWRAKLVVMN